MTVFYDHTTARASSIINLPYPRMKELTSFCPVLCFSKFVLPLEGKLQTTTVEFIVVISPSHVPLKTIAALHTPVSAQPEAVSTVSRL